MHQIIEGLVERAFGGESVDAADEQSHDQKATHQQQVKLDKQLAHDDELNKGADLTPATRT